MCFQAVASQNIRPAVCKASADVGCIRTEILLEAFRNLRSVKAEHNVLFGGCVVQPDVAVFGVEIIRFSILVDGSVGDLVGSYRLYVAVRFLVNIYLEVVVCIGAKPQQRAPSELRQGEAVAFHFACIAYGNIRRVGQVEGENGVSQRYGSGGALLM